MRIIVFLNQLGLGGTEKAAARWARGLRERGHHLCIMTLEDKGQGDQFRGHDTEVRVVRKAAGALRDHLRSWKPDVIHIHAPGHPHRGDILGEALVGLPGIPVLQTNVFGQLHNPKEDTWIKCRLFVSWTSCVQAARRSFRPLDKSFFQFASVAVNPVDREEPSSRSEINAFREAHGIGRDEILLGRLSRPEANKWTDLAVEAFRRALRQNPRLKLLLREPPPQVTHLLSGAVDRGRFVILPVSSDADELKLTMSSLDIVLHTSLIGESFGYGIAEPMNLGKPVIANSTPWADQAQLELVRHGECGFIASTSRTMAQAILKLANDPTKRQQLGQNAQLHIRQLANPIDSITRVEAALRLTAAREENPKAAEDLSRALATRRYLDEHQFGIGWREQLALRPHYYRLRLGNFRRFLRPRTLSYD